MVELRKSERLLNEMQLENPLAADDLDNRKTSSQEMTLRRTCKVRRCVQQITTHRCACKTQGERIRESGAGCPCSEQTRMDIPRIGGRVRLRCTRVVYSTVVRTVQTWLRSFSSGTQTLQSCCTGATTEKSQSTTRS